MTEPQIWTVIGVMSAAFFGMMAIVSTMFVRVLRSEIGAVRDVMVARFAVVDARFDAVESRFVSLEAKVDSLDRDVQGIIARELDRD